MPGDRDSAEFALAIRRFEGVNLAIDPAFLPPSQLQRAANFVPAAAGALTNRRGTATYLTLAGVSRIEALRYVVADSGTRYCYAACQRTAATDALFVSTNDGAFALVSAFASTGKRYGMAVLGGTLYVGNDTDPLKSVVFGGAAVDLTALAAANDTGQGITPAADATSGLLGGTYSYRWAVYDTVLKRWTAIGPVRTVTVAGAAWYRLDTVAPQAGAPATVLGANERWHLFVTQVDEEIEGAHDQAPEGFAAAGTMSLLAITTTGTVVPTPSSVVRKSPILLAHRARLWGADGRRVWASSPLIPGLEQAIYDMGIFYPAAAFFDLPAPVTGLGVGTLTSGTQQPQAPIVAFTATSTWLFWGDPVGDPGARREQVSDEIGCVATQTVVPTPIGLLFLGDAGVYLAAPGAQEPVNVGWPIEPALRAIPRAARPMATAVYHKGFYKLCVAPAGATANTQEWWLDLRRGLGQFPSWWGPHAHPFGVTTFGRTTRHPTEDDRGFAAVAGGGVVVLIDQATSQQDQGTTIVSDLRTARLDGGKPLQPKLVKRCRAIGKVNAPTTLAVAILIDDITAAAGTLPLTGVTAAQWNTAHWNMASWGSTRVAKGTYVPPPPEPRGCAIECTVTHAQPVALELRDFEVRVQPAPREED